MLLAAILGVWCSALAALPEDVATAADTGKPLAVRREAWDRIVTANTPADVIKLADKPGTSRAHRWVAIRSLAPVQDDLARSALLRYLDAPDASTRMAALGALGDRGDITLSGRVSAKLQDKALLVRAAACDALGRLRDPGTLADLERALADPSNSYRGTSLWLRRRFAEAMGLIGTDAAVPYLARALDDGDAEVAGAARRGLEQIAGFSYSEGRTPAEEREAWRRWAGR